MNGPAPPLGCPVCGGAALARYPAAGRHALLRCASCDLVFSPTEPAPHEIERHYSAPYFTGGGVEYADYVADAATHREQARRYLDTIAEFTPLPCSVLDIGCAAGFFLDEARHRGCRTFGCDVSEYAAAYAAQTLGLEVERAAFLDATLLPDQVDVATAFNVFEHLTEPRAVVRRLEGVVRPGGCVILETWDYRSLVARLLRSRWHQWDPPFVPYYYTRRALAALFPPPAWHMLRYAPTSKRVPLARLWSALPNRLSITYALGDLVLAVFRRESRGAE
ncbi:MAG TPA: class I SAM-dependent methyltransferase [Gemmatimonadales bacterium]|nr:class I SAM-dependent methyltransferase [Gemmatimonadales bacterium]